MENASKALIIAGAILISILLITIGVILVNSGKGIAETGASNMNSQKIQTFNAQFTPYEGVKKGSEIKNLINLVNASNASDEEHQILLDLNGSYCGPDFKSSLLKSSANYKVDIEYFNSTKDQSYISEPGYIYKINVTGI